MTRLISDQCKEHLLVSIEITVIMILPMCIADLDLRPYGALSIAISAA